MLVSVQYTVFVSTHLYCKVYVCVNTLYSMHVWKHILYRITTLLGKRRLNEHNRIDLQVSNHRTHQSITTWLRGTKHCYCVQQRHINFQQLSISKHILHPQHMTSSHYQQVAHHATDIPYNRILMQKLIISLSFQMRSVLANMQLYCNIYLPATYPE